MHTDALAAGDVDPLGIDPAIVLGEQCRDQRVDVGRPVGKQRGVHRRL